MKINVIFSMNIFMTEKKNYLVCIKIPPDEDNKVENCLAKELGHVTYSGQ